jgi:predicted transcriptional regulator of viral defense system
MSHSAPKSAQNLRKLFLTRGGYLTASEVRGENIYAEQLARFVQDGCAERVQRGVYRLLDETVPFGAAEELLEVQLRIPYARPCLVSALHLHALTTTRPTVLQFAVPANRTAPRLEFPQIQIFYFRPASYTFGTAELPVASRRLTTYTPEKTLADLLNYAPKYGRDVYLEGLKKYLSQFPERGTWGLLEAAGVLGVSAPMRRDLEVLRHDQDH